MSKNVIIANFCTINEKKAVSLQQYNIIISLNDEENDNHSVHCHCRNRYDGLQREEEKRQYHHPQGGEERTCRPDKNAGIPYVERRKS